MPPASSGVGIAAIGRSGAAATGAAATSTSTSTSYNNVNRNRQIDAGQNEFQHNAANRKGVPYRDQASRDKYGQGRGGAEARSNYRGRDPVTESRRQQAQSTLQSRGMDPAQARDQLRNDPATRERAQAAAAGSRDRGNVGGGQGGVGGGRDGGAGNIGASRDRAQALGGNEHAFRGANNPGQSRQQFDRGSASRQSASNFSGGGGARGGGGGGGRRRWWRPPTLTRGDAHVDVAFDRRRGSHRVAGVPAGCSARVRAEELHDAGVRGQALVKAMRANDTKALQTVLGQDWRRFIPTDDLSRDDVNAFLAGWDQSHKIDNEGDDTALISVGAEPGFTLPIPIVKNKAALWKFDVVSGTDRLRTARIGRNELAAMQAVLAYYDAQREYATEDRSGKGVREYARRLVSSPGKKDGLFWPAKLDEPESPLGPLLAQQKPKAPGYWGYYYKILTGQGKDAPGGAYDYVIGRRMRAGFALVAWPVRYGDTGVMTFMVSHAWDRGRERPRAEHRRHRARDDTL